MPVEQKTTLVQFIDGLGPDKDLDHWIYAGSDSDIDYYRKTTGFIRRPKYTNSCICNHRITYNFYIFNWYTGEVKVVGSSCVMYLSKQRKCNNYDTCHQRIEIKSKYRECTQCRKPRCKRCEKVFSSYKFSVCKPCRRYFPDKDMIRKDIYRFKIDVPFAYKEIAKSHGGRWNGIEKHWYCYDRQTKENIERKIQEEKQKSLNKI